MASRRALDAMPACVFIKYGDGMAVGMLEDTAGNKKGKRAIKWVKKRKNGCFINL